MRQLLLPACVCLVVLPSVTDVQPRLTLEEFSQRTAAYAPREATRKTDIDLAEPVVVALPPRDETPAPTLDLANAAFEFPVPSGVVVNNGIPIGIPLPPIAKPVVARSTEEICDTLVKSAQINDLPAPFLISLLFRESRFDPAVISSAGAQGIAQFMPDTAADMGVENPFDPALAIPASARLLNSLVRQFGNLGLAAAAYNAGPKRVQDWLGSKGKGKLPDETQGYVKIVTGHPVENWTEASAQHPGEKLPRRAPCQESAGLLAWNGPDAVPVPQPSPLRAPPAEKSASEKSPADKPVVVAAVRSDMKQADRAEREAAARGSVKSETKVFAKNETRNEKKIDKKSETKGPAHAAGVAPTAKPIVSPTGKSATKRETIAQR